MEKTKSRLVLFAFVGVVDLLAGSALLACSETASGPSGQGIDAAVAQDGSVPHDAAAPEDTGAGQDVAAPADTGMPDAGVTGDGGSVDSAGDIGVECNACTDGQKRCEGIQVQLCVTLVDGCTAWSVDHTCTSFEECREPDLECVVPETEPHGSFLTTVPDASWGIEPESMLWDGVTGIISLSTGVAGTRVLGFLRFNAAGPIRPARMTTEDQESSLAEAGGRTFVHWRVGTSNAFIGEVLADESIGTYVSSDHNSMGQNVHAFGVGTGVFLYQTSVFGGTNAYMGFFNPATWAISWYDDQPLFEWYSSTAAAAEIPGGFAASWITSDMSSVALQRFDAAGAPVNDAAVSPLDAPVGDATTLALLPDTEGFTLIWVTDFTVHLSRFDAAGSLLTDTAVETSELVFKNARWVGSQGQDLLVSCHPDSSGTALVVARLSREGTLLGSTLLTSHGGIARYAGGMLAACWGVPDEGIKCGVVAFP